jgi:hypothetical protein
LIIIVNTVGNETVRIREVNMPEYGEWNRKGATLSDVNAQKEYGITRAFIEDGIRDLIHPHTPNLRHSSLSRNYSRSHRQGWNSRKQAARKGFRSMFACQMASWLRSDAHLIAKQIIDIDTVRELHISSIHAGMAGNIGRMFSYRAGKSAKRH